MAYSTGLVRLTAVLVCLTGCSRYAFSVNENRVYTPPPLFNDYQIADKSLAACVERSIAEQAISRASQLRKLECVSAGVRSLSGLEVFSGLRTINLADNQLRSVRVLMGTQAQTRVNLQGNSGLDCVELFEFAALGAEIRYPDHCQQPQG